MRCTCDQVDVTAIGDAARSFLLDPDPECLVHGPGIKGQKIDGVWLDEQAPEVECVVCHEVWPLKSSSWNEHDPRHVGWWCARCRHDAGFG